MIIVTPGQMKFLEAEADRNGNTYESLMEKAGKKLSEKITEMLSNKSDNKSILFLCGNGNNAGDCFVASRYLEKSGVKCTAAMLCGEPKTDIAELNFNRMRNTDIVYGIEKTLELLDNNKFGIIADGVFGTGFHGELPEDICEVFDKCRKNASILAVDVPSGGNCSTGAVSEGTLSADETITFGFSKFGLTQYPLKKYAGNVTAADIEIREEYTRNFKYIIRQTDINYAKTVIPPKAPDSHKGTYGRLLTVCGSENMPGACIMSVEAALKSGAGLIEAAAVKPVIPVIASAAPECMFCPLEADSDGFITENNYDVIIEKSKKATAVLIGCGLGVTESTKKLVKRLICDIDCPIILDADGINCIADSIDIIKQNRSGIIITPHPAEMGRICGRTTKEVQSDRLNTALDFSEKYGAVVVLKGAGTIIAQSDKVYVNPNGNAGMGKGGSGDVLSGIIASLTAQGINLFDSAVLGAFVHGLAGDIAAEELSMQSMTATDIIKNLPRAYKMIME